jgi:hypothetical protein
MNKVALGQGFLRVLLFSPVSIITSMLHIHLHLHVAVTRRENGRNLGTFPKAALFRNLGSIRYNVFTFLSMILFKHFSTVFCLQYPYSVIKESG